MSGCVLLVRSRSDLAGFVHSSPRVFLPDELQLANLFSTHPVQLLAVNSLNLPYLAPLLRLCPTAPPLLSQAVQFTSKHADDLQLHRWSSLLPSASSFYARAAYSLDAPSFAASVESGRISGLCKQGAGGIQVLSSQSITQCYELGECSIEQNGRVAVEVLHSAEAPEVTTRIIINEDECADSEEALEVLASHYAGQQSTTLQFILGGCLLFE